jgi:hypothetical protein
MFDYDTKEKEHQNTQQSDLYSGGYTPRTNQIASCFGALSITYSTSAINSVMNLHEFNILFITYQK